MQKIVLGGVAATVAAVVGAALWLAATPAPDPLPPAVMQTGDTEFGAPFELTDHTGARVRSADLIDGPTLLYFGYTFCPDVCPLDTAHLAEAVEMLEAEGIRVTPVFVTVDPARDDPEALGYWVEAHHPRMVGLTGTEAEIDRVAEAYGVYHQTVETPESAAKYLVNHTAYMYLETPEGVLALIRQNSTPAEIAGAVRAVLARHGAD